MAPKTQFNKTENNHFQIFKVILNLEREFKVFFVFTLSPKQGISHFLVSDKLCAKNMKTNE